MTSSLGRSQGWRRLGSAVMALAVTAPLVLAWPALAATAQRQGTKEAPATVPTGPLRPAAKALYESRRWAPLWRGDRTAEGRRQAILALLQREQRLDPTLRTDPARLAESFGRTSSDGRVDADLMLTDAAFDYLERRRGGEMTDARLALLALAEMGGARLDSELAVALLELKVVRLLGGWRPVTMRQLPAPPPIPVTDEIGFTVMVEQPRPKPVPEETSLARRLIQSGDLPARYLTTTPSEAPLRQAVTAFQGRHGLVADGTVGARTQAALNASIGEHVARVEVNLRRRDELASRKNLSRYVEVNIPSHELKVVQGGKVVLRSRVIVGDEESQTPIFDDQIRSIELNPSWYVPVSIVPELVQKAAKEPGYFQKNGFVWQEAGTKLVQKPGPENALGRFKFLFPNRHAVYLHDTAQRNLFNRSDRSLSHGCIRVEKVFELAEVLLAGDGWSRERIDAGIKENRTKRIELSQPVPVFLDYSTALIDERGRLLLMPDIYKYDADSRVTFSGKRTIVEEAVVRQRAPALPSVGVEASAEPAAQLN